MVPRTGEPTVLSANPVPDALLGYFGSLSTVLVLPLVYPWTERAKPLGGRAAVSHVGCCVFCVVVFCAGPYFWLTNI
jgi:hypothetical protein